LNLNEVIYCVSYINSSDKGKKMFFFSMLLFKRENTKHFTRQQKLSMIISVVIY